MDTIEEGRYEDTNKIFEKPEKYKRDYHVAKWFDDTHVQLVPIVERFMKNKTQHQKKYADRRMENENV